MGDPGFDNSRNTGRVARIWIEPFEITAGRLHLRPWQAGDAPDVLRAFGDPHITAAQSSRQVRDLAAAREYAEHLADWSDGTHASFAVVDAVSAALLGSVSLHQLNPRQQDAEIGYWTMPDARGQGVATQVVGVVTRWAFAELGLERIMLLHAVDNDASCRVAAKVGYLLEGTMRSSHRYGDGLRHDEHLHARLRTDRC